MEIILGVFKRYIICSTLALLIIILGIFVWSGLIERYDKRPTDDASFDAGHHSRSSQSSQSSVGNPQIGEGTEHLHVFLQVSDLHLSIYHDLQRGPDFADFCNNTVPIYSPEVVLVTGDITDAKFPDKQGSVQFESEWQLYQQILAQSRVLQKTVWLDVRGNHDAFDVPSMDSNVNYYAKYSIQGLKHSKSYHYVHKTSGGDVISFIAVDSCPDPGPRRPFNFFGVITEENLDRLEQLEAESRSSNTTIWFGHYPTSVVTGDLNRLRKILGRGSVYLAGHLHTLGGLANNMYARQQSGYITLEVGDWMANRMYRLFVVDHGLISFTDQNLNRWPVILITNPKDAKFLLPHKEPLDSMLYSSHIRILAFSPAVIKITRIHVFIDGEQLGEAEHLRGPLYTLRWTPANYARGLHHMTVHAHDSDGVVTSVSQQFSLDGTSVSFDLWRRFLLMGQHHIEGKILFALAFTMMVLPMILSKAINFTIDMSGSLPGRCFSMLWLYQFIIRRYKILANTPSVFWPLLAFHFYVAIGPWCVGEIMKGHIGAIFVYGVFVHGSFIPGSLTFLYGFFQIMLFNFPLTHYLAHVLDHRICAHKNDRKPKAAVLRLIGWLLHHSVFYCMLAFQFYLAYSGTYKSYGLVAFILSPVRLWSIILALGLRQVARGKRHVQTVQNKLIHSEDSL